MGSIASISAITIILRMMSRGRLARWIEPSIPNREQVNIIQEQKIECDWCYHFASISWSDANFEIRNDWRRLQAIHVQLNWFKFEQYSRNLAYPWTMRHLFFITLTKITKLCVNCIGFDKNNIATMAGERILLPWFSVDEVARRLNLIAGRKRSLTCAWAHASSKLGNPSLSERYEPGFSGPNIFGVHTHHTATDP